MRCNWRRGRALEARRVRSERLSWTPRDDVEGLEADHRLTLSNLAGEPRDVLSESGSFL
jgi:hypothetical protein